MACATHTLENWGERWEYSYCQQRHDQEPKLKADCSNILGDVISKTVTGSSRIDQKELDHLRVVHELQ